MRRPDSERLTEIARRRSTTVVEVLHSAIEALERQDFLRGLTEDLQRLSPAEREALFAEQQAWDNLA
jgi:predicted ATPase